MHRNDLDQPVGFPVGRWEPPSAPDGALLHGQYCSLEPLGEEHASALFAANTLDDEGRMWTYMSYGPFPTLEAYQAWLAKVAGKRDPLFYAILNRDKEAVGVASYLRVAPARGSLEVGHIAFSPALQKTAAATEAMYLMMRHAFDLGYRRYEWKCDALNAGSRRAAERLGFTFEGIFRQATIYKNRNRDTAWFAVIDKDWLRLKAAFKQWLHPSNFAANGAQRTRLSELTSVS